MTSQTRAFLLPEREKCGNKIEILHLLPTNNIRGHIEVVEESIKRS